MQEDLALLAQEARRCREILRKLNSLGTDEAHVLNVLALDTLIEEVVEPLRDQDVEVIVTKDGPSPSPSCARNPGMLYGLGNLVENAVDFAKIKSADLGAMDTHTGQHHHRGRWSRLCARNIATGCGDPYLSGKSTQRRLKGDPGIWTGPRPGTVHRQNLAGALRRYI